MKLADGRTMVVEVPGRWTADDHDGSVLLLPEGVRFLDRVQTLATKRLHSVTPAYITTLREALGMTQTEFGNKIGVAKLSVSRWERGQLRPSKESLAEIEKLRHDAIKQGVVLA